ncbi:hypothetical protein [Streptococcus ferus]|uniref:hypothetical protein n=1 Tax=Streptococcus ferus TaxID=1345 RepID=UPI0035A15786
MSRPYSDRERVEIARREYTNYSVESDVRIAKDNGEKLTISTVREVVTDDTGLKVYTK